MPESSTPIFIVGCQRSGTTLLRLMLDAHPNISCGPETRFLPDLARITSTDWRRLSRYGFPKEYWHAQIAQFFDNIQREYAATRGKTRWADKSPRYALAIDYLSELFPSCQIVHVVRDGRDVVASHRRRWGWSAAAKAVVKWPRYIRAAQAAGRELPPDRYCEIRYEELVGNPRATLERLLQFLGEPWDDAVLAHEKRDHDVSPHYAVLTTQRREAATDDSAVYKNRVGAYRRDLDPLLRLSAALVQRTTLRELGYSGR